MEELKPKVGVGVMIFKDGKVLLGKRKGSHGEGEYAFPGGHLHYMESFAQCAKRETKEETGIEIDDVNFLLLSNIIQYAPKHYVNLIVKAMWISGEPQVLEPEKCESWNWYSLEDLPYPIFDACKISFDSYQSGKNYYDAEN